MNTIPITISLVIVALGVLYRQSTGTTQVQRDSGVDYIKRILTPTITVVPTEYPKPPIATTLIPPMVITPTYEIIKEPSVPVKSRNFDTWLYPGAMVVNDQHGVQSISSHDPGRITSWYEDKIKSVSMQVVTFVKTNANGEVKNTLGASDKDGSIRIEISKTSGSDTTSIIITRQ